jgi:hypothetical protein
MVLSATGWPYFGAFGFKSHIDYVSEYGGTIFESDRVLEIAYIIKHWMEVLDTGELITP